MAISEASEIGLSAARAKASKQDPNCPMLIHVDDARLMPNTPLLRKNPKYRPYRGELKASHEQRMRYLEMGGRGGRAVYDSTQQEPFDIATAKPEDLVAFAMTEYDATLDLRVGEKMLRQQVLELAQKAGAVKSPPLMEQGESLV